MKDLVQQGVSGVVIIRGDSAHLPLIPPPASNIVIQVNCSDHVTSFHKGTCEKEPSHSYGLLELKDLSAVPKHVNPKHCLIESSCSLSNSDSLCEKLNNNNDLGPCLVKTKEENDSSFVPLLDQTSRSVGPEPQHSRRMTHSPGGHHLFGTTDSPGQPPPFRMSSSSAVQQGDQIPNQPGSVETGLDVSAYPSNQRNICDARRQALSSPTWGESAENTGRSSFDHHTASKHLAPPPRFEEPQEFHGTSPLSSMSAIRPRHYSGGEIAVEMHRKQQQQQQKQEQQQQLYQQTLQVQGHHGSAPLFHGSAPFLSCTTLGEHVHRVDSDVIYSQPGATTPTWTHSSHIQQRFAPYRNPSDPHLSSSSSYDESSVEPNATYGSNTSIPTSAQLVPTDFSSGGARPSHQPFIAGLPEIQMTEMVSEAEQATPWMSHTPDNLSPTVQIVHKLAQATVSDNMGHESPLTTSSGNNSPRTAKMSKSVLQIPTPDISPSLSPTSCTKQKQRFIFPDVPQTSNPKTSPGHLPPGLTLESAGLHVSLATIKAERHRWRHVSSGSSGDSSTAGEANLVAPSPSFASPQVMSASGGSGSGAPGVMGRLPPSRQRFCSGDTDIDDTLVDSETGSSVVEDSGSSREQSPFSTGGLEHGTRSATSPTLRSTASPTLRRLSPSGRRGLHRQPVVVAAEDDPDNLALTSGEEEKLQTEDERLQPPKFKRRLHERYVSSLREDMPRTGEEISGSATSSESAIETKPVLKLEAVELDSDLNESSLPKSPRRSVSDDIPRTDSYELSADEGDVFMEPVGVSQRLKPRNQQKPLDLSRSNQSTPTFPAAMLRTGSLTESESSTTSPSLKSHYPQLYRSPHRLNFSPHGLMSPQSQSPLCSVPEGGRIFNFSMQSPFEGNAGAHSDTDIISPSPMSPRFFTFPSVVPSHSASQLLNPMSEVNRLAVSPRALYPTSPIQFSLKSKTVSHIKWENLSKRSFSDSDVAYQCPICGQVFPSNDNLAKHMAKHLPTETIRSSDNNKIHYCKVCDRSFSRSDMLTRHMRLHTGLKPYECMDCGQVFSRSDHLNTHKRTHTGEKPYRCPHCPYAACRRDMITRHMRTHTKRTPKRNRYLSVPDNTSSTEAQAGSVSSAETPESHSTARSRACSSLSSIDSLDLEISPSGQSQRWLAQASVESLPQTEDSGMPTHASTSSHDSEDAEEFNPALWPRKAAPSPLIYQEGGGGGGAPLGHHSMDDDAFLAAEPIHLEKRPREPSPHPRGHFFSIPPAPPPSLIQGHVVAGASGPRQGEITRFPKSSSSSSSSVSRDSTS